MKRYSGLSYDILGVHPADLVGYTVEDIENAIRAVQSGVIGERMTDDEIKVAAVKIWEEVVYSKEDNED